MSSTKVISVSLPPKQVARIEQAVENGDFNTRSSFVNTAVRELLKRLDEEKEAQQRSSGRSSSQSSQDGVA
jgi:Arc/MetJ-type ribon-helix-helix transcriptional regulator